MARNPVTAAATVCQACGAKVRADRDRCPRCRAHLTVAAPAATPASSRRLMQAAAGVVGLFVLAVLGLWMARPRVPGASSSAAAVDPLASRRSAQAAAPAAPPAATPEQPAVDPRARPFMDASGAGSAAYGAGDYTAALARYQEAVTRNPQDAESLSNLGQVLVKMNRPAEAIPYFQKAAEILPGRWAYHFNLARALGLAGRSDDAITSYRRAQALFPDDYATAFNLAMALHHRGDEAEAVVQYQKAIALQPGDASFRKALGISLEQLQKGQEAAAAYQEYLRLAPSAPDADKVRERITTLQRPAGA